MMPSSVLNGGSSEFDISHPVTGRNHGSRGLLQQQDQPSLSSGNLMLDNKNIQVNITDSKRKEILSSKVLNMLMNDLDISKQPSMKKLNHNPKYDGAESAEVRGSQQKKQEKRIPKLLFKSLSTEHIFTSRKHGMHEEVELEGSTSFSLDDDTGNDGVSATSIECAKPHRALFKSFSNPRIVRSQDGAGFEGIGNLGSLSNSSGSGSGSNKNVGNCQFTDQTVDLKERSSLLDASLEGSITPNGGTTRMDSKWSKKRFTAFMATAVATPSRVSHKIKGVATTAASSILDPMKRGHGETGSTPPPPPTAEACSIIKSSSIGEIGHIESLSVEGGKSTWATLRGGSANELKDYLRIGRKDHQTTSTSSSSQNSVWETTSSGLFTHPRRSTASKQLSISEIRQDSTTLVNDYLKRFGGQQQQQNQNILYCPESPMASSSSEEDEENPTPASSSIQSYVQLQIPLAGDEETEAEVKYSTEEAHPNEIRSNKQKDAFRRSIDSKVCALSLEDNHQPQHNGTQGSQASSLSVVALDAERVTFNHPRLHRSRSRGEGIHSSGHRRSKSEGGKCSTKRGRSISLSNPRRHRDKINSSRTRADDFTSSSHPEVRRRRRNWDTVPVSGDESKASIVKVTSSEGSSPKHTTQREDLLKSSGHISRSRSRDGRRKKTSLSPKRNDSTSNNIYKEPITGEPVTASNILTTIESLRKEQSSSKTLKNDDSIPLEYKRTSRSRSREKKKRTGGSRSSRLTNSTNCIPAAHNPVSEHYETNLNHSSWHFTSRSRSNERRSGRKGSRSPNLGDSISSINSANSIIEPDNVTGKEENLNASWHARSRRRRSSRDRRGFRREHRSPTRVVRSSRSRSSERLSQKSSATESRCRQHQQGSSEEEVIPVMMLHTNGVETKKFQKNRRCLHPPDQSQSLRNLFQQDDSSSPASCDSPTVRLSNSFVF